MPKLKTNSTPTTDYPHPPVTYAGQQGKSVIARYDATTLFVVAVNWQRWRGILQGVTIQRDPRLGTNDPTPMCEITGTKEEVDDAEATLHRHFRGGEDNPA